VQINDEQIPSFYSNRKLKIISPNELEYDLLEGNGMKIADLLSFYSVLVTPFLSFFILFASNLKFYHENVHIYTKEVAPIKRPLSQCLPASQASHSIICKCIMYILLSIISYSTYDFGMRFRTHI
jgi:hypothetical protein